MATPGADAPELLAGLTSAEAAARRVQYGPNRVAEERPNPLRALLGKFSAPVPWMLEATIALELLVHRPGEAALIGALLVFNAAVSFFQESQANRALSLLRQTLAVQTRVRRDGSWKLAPAEELVPGDAVYLRLGDLAPADIRLADGALQANQSDLTGESLPVAKAAGATVYAGSRIERGEAHGEVTATGSKTYFGKTAELVKTARTVSHLQEVILGIVRYLVALDAVLVGALLAYAGWTHLPWAEVLPFALILLVASVPVALPATVTVATALGALEVARQSVLVTRLSALEEAAAMDVLCTDKTGTITQNRLAVAAVRPVAGRTAAEVLAAAALASDAATQDPLDLAVLAAAQHTAPPGGRLAFLPFDPATKRSEAVYEHAGGRLRVIKGAPDTVAGLANNGAALAHADVEALAARGARVLAVAAGPDGAPELVGLLALEDPVREDSRQLVESLRQLGVRVIMVTGDSAPTARAVAAEVGIGARVGLASELKENAADAAGRYDVFAGVFPEDKFKLVSALQHHHHVVGMTGDGVNDAPALKQAEVGIAVSSATDVAKAAASIVLTESGLGGVVRAVETGRKIHQRMLTYTLNKIIKTLEIAIFLSVGVIVTGTFVITPLLIVLLLFTNDFVTMSVATDRVCSPPQPERWNARRLVLTAVPLAALLLTLSFSVFFVGRDGLRLPLPELQTLVFLMLVFTGQGTVYLVRERARFWHSRPSRWLIISSVADIVVVSLLATHGILMAPISWRLIGALLATVVVFLFGMDAVKVRLFRRFGVG